jgi:hypothetical protein
MRAELLVFAFLAADLAFLLRHLLLQANQGINKPHNCKMHQACWSCKPMLADAGRKTQAGQQPAASNPVDIDSQNRSKRSTNKQNTQLKLRAL